MLPYILSKFHENAPRETEKHPIDDCQRKNDRHDSFPVKQICRNPSDEDQNGIVDHIEHPHQYVYAQHVLGAPEERH
jgi:hypothetical protein